MLDNLGAVAKSQRAELLGVLSYSIPMPGLMPVVAMATQPAGPWAAMINAAGGVRGWLYGGLPEFFAESSAETAGRELVAVALSETRVLTVISAGPDRFSLDEGALDGDLRRTEPSGSRCVAR